MVYEQITAPSRTSVVIEPFEAWHILCLDLQAEQVHLRPWMTHAYGEQLLTSGPCFTAWAGTTVVACAGIGWCWPGRAQVWSLMSVHLPQYKWTIHRAVASFLRGFTVRRLELEVDPDFPRAVAWAKALGFQYESTMPAYGPNGETQDRYVRLQKGDR